MVWSLSIYEITSSMRIGIDIRTVAAIMGTDFKVLPNCFDMPQAVKGAVAEALPDTTLRQREVLERVAVATS